MPEEPSKQPQFLFVDDDPEYLAILSSVLKEISKSRWAIRTATNHSQALEHLKANPVDVVLLDIEMPVMDGIEFLRLLARTHPGLRVVMLSSRLDEGARKTCMELGASLYLEKPTSPQAFQAIFSALDALALTGRQAGFRGMMQLGLHEVLQMECLGRKSCVLSVSTSNRRGHIYVFEGEIIHAESGQIQGEMALYSLLGLSGGEFSLQPFTEPPRKSISGQYEFLLMEAARLRDETGSQAPRPGSLGGNPDLQAALGEATITTEARGIRIEEALLCSSAGEVLYQWKCESLESRIDLFKRVEKEAMLASKGTPSGRFHRVSLDMGNSRFLVLIQPTFRLLIRSALQPPLSNQ